MSDIQKDTIFNGIPISVLDTIKVLDATPFPIAIVDLQDNNIYFWSRSAQKLFGHTAPTAAEWYEIAYPDPDYRNEAIGRWKAFLEVAKSTGQTVNTGEYQITCSDGSVRICELFASFLEDRLIVTFNDITERKKVEDRRIAQLKKASENMCMFVKHAPICIAMFDCSMNYLAASDHWIADYGRGYSDLVGCNHYVIHPDIPEQWKKVHQQCLAGATLKHDEDYWEQSDGIRHWLSWAVLPWYSPDGKVGGIIMSAEDITQRKLAELTLRESQERFMLMVNAMPQMGWIAGPDGYITWYNERWYNYTGTTPEEMEGWGWQVVHDKVELPKVLDRWKSSINTGEPFEMTFPLRGADGNFRRFLTRVYPLKNEDGQVVQWFGTNTDVEEQSRAATLLQESEVRFRLLVEQAADGIFVADAQGNYIDVNSVGCSMLGYTREELLKLMLVDVLDPVEWPRLGPTIESYADGKTHVSEWRFLRKNRSIFIGEVRGRQLSNGNLQGILIDITERKLAERRLQESEKRYRYLFENMLDGVVYLQVLRNQGIPEDFNILNANSQFEELTGLTMVIGQQFSEVIPSILAENAVFLEVTNRVASFSSTERFETFVEEFNKWFSITIYSPIEEYFVAVFRDITDQRRVEQEQIFLNSQLAHEIAKRTVELSGLAAHVQTIAEQERARLARELHDELGCTLVGMSMEVGHLKGKITDPYILKGLSVLKDLITHAVEIKRNVINELNPSILNDAGFSGALKWMVGEFRKRSEIEVELLMPEEINIVEPYSLAAYRITQECLTNVAKHAGAKKVVLHANAKDGFLKLTITDNGQGLPSDIKTGGHGIMGMIERARYLGGTMDIFSEGNNGTTASLRIPLNSAKPARKKRVLVVDDHAIVRDALKRLIGETNDFSVEGEAADGRSALQMATEMDWDIILLDLTLPIMNGLTVLEKIREAKADVPIIILSSHSAAEYGDEAISKGATCYLEKGETDKLVEEMRRATILQ
jgi:PAS domain S-box-containing protein